jgi:hypothetical protein
MVKHCAMTLFFGASQAFVTFMLLNCTFLAADAQTTTHSTNEFHLIPALLNHDLSRAITLLPKILQIKNFVRHWLLSMIYGQRQISPCV